MTASHPRLSDNFDDEAIEEFIEPICTLADTDTSYEAGGVIDDDMDELILAARKVRDREGFLVVAGEAAE